MFHSKKKVESQNIDYKEDAKKKPKKILCKASLIWFSNIKDSNF